MSCVYVTSDWHFGHKSITTNFRTQFSSMEHMEEVVLENTMRLVKRRDVLYCLGDMAFDQRGLDKIAQIPCRKVLVRGNHDNHLTTQDFLEVFDSVEGAFRYKKYWFTHIPIHSSELYHGKNVHGHCHRGGPAEHQIGDSWGSYYNAILEYNDYSPVNMQYVGQVFSDRLL